MKRTAEWGFGKKNDPQVPGSRGHGASRKRVLKGEVSSAHRRGGDKPTSGRTGIDKKGVRRYREEAQSVW